MEKTSSKVILFTSMPNGTFPGRYIRGFLEHALAVQNSCSSQPPDPRASDRFDSEFERDVCERLRANGLDVSTQVPVAGYWIDLVVRDKAGRRLGIECDGAFHYDEFGQLREEDYEREEILERAGWAIHRIPSRRFYLNPETEIDLALNVLAGLATDEQISYLEFEDLAPSYGEAEVETQPTAAPTPTPVAAGTSMASQSAPSGSPPPEGARASDWGPDAPPFDNYAVWVEASRWARDIGHWTMANRVFLWEFGYKIRDGKTIEESDRARAGVLWANALRHGFCPSRPATNAVKQEPPS